MLFGHWPGAGVVFVCFHSHKNEFGPDANQTNCDSQFVCLLGIDCQCPNSDCDNSVALEGNDFNRKIHF